MATATATQPEPATRPKITAEAFLGMDLGEGAFELVRGEVVELAPSENAHGYVCGNVGALLLGFGRRTRHGHTTNDSAVMIDDLTVRGADVSYYSKAQCPRALVGTGRPPVAPDLVVEVLSPGNKTGVMLTKIGEYLSAGVRMVWVIDPKRRTLTIYRPEEFAAVVLAEGDAVADLPELPGSGCEVAEFFS